MSTSGVGPSPAASGGAHVRAAGVLFAAAVLGRGMDATTEIIQLRRFAASAFWMMTVIIPGVQLTIDVVELVAAGWLAAAYLRGRPRHRSLLILLVTLGFLGPTVSRVSSGFLWPSAGVWAAPYFVPAVFLIAVLALVVGRPSRPRFAAGIVFLALYAITAAGQVAYFVSNARLWS